MEPTEPAVPTKGQTDEIDRRARTAVGDAGAVARSPKVRKIKLYDFKRPDRFSKDQTRVIQMMHESFARLTSCMLSAQLGCVVHVHVASVDQLTYEEFIRSIPNPTTLARIAMDPLKGEAILEIDPSITFATVDRLFGGNGSGFKLSRDLTSVESSVMEGILARMLGHLREAWSAFIDLRPRLEGIETNPLFAQIVPPTEMAVLVTLETSIGDVVGMMNLCIPYLTIQDVVPKLSQQLYYLSIRSVPPTPPVALADLAVDVEVLYEGEKVSLGHMTRLKRGSLVRMPGYAEGRAILRAGGAPLFRLEAKRVRGRREPAYTLADCEGGTSLAFLGRRKKTSEAQEKPDTLGLAMRTLSTEITGAIKSLDAKVSGLARRQEELSDQLIFQSPDKEVSSAGEETGEKRPVRPFHFLSVSACEPLAALLSGEHPQLIALVLSYLEPGLAACVLTKIPEEAQTDVTARIAAMGRVLPETLREVERVLEAQMRVALSADYLLAGGIDAVTEILGVVDRGTERQVLESLGKRDPELAEDIKKRMFVFEDIVLLAGEDVQRILREVAEEDVLLALKSVVEPVRTKVWESLPREKAGALQNKLAQIGRVRLRDVEAAQQRIVGVIRKLEEEGKIVLARAGESQVVG